VRVWAVDGNMARESWLEVDRELLELFFGELLVLLLQTDLESLSVNGKKKNVREADDECKHKEKVYRYLLSLLRIRIVVYYRQILKPRSHIDGCFRIVHG